MESTEVSPLVADLFEAAGAMRRHGEAFAGAAGQTQARWQLLSVAGEGDWTVPHIARRLGITRQAVQRTADELRAEGLLRTEPNPNHQRSPYVRPTETGRDALAAITEHSSEWQADVAAGLDPGDVAAARRVLRALANAPTPRSGRARRAPTAPGP